MRKITKQMLGLLVVLFVTLPGISSAALTQEHIERFKLDIWSLRADFNMLTIMAGDKVYERTLNRSIQRATGSFAELANNAESETEQALVETVRPLWNNIQDLSRQNTVAELGYTDGYVVQDLNRFTAEASMALDNFDEASTIPYGDLLSLSTFMQRIASEYLAIAAAPDGGMASGTDVGRIEFRDVVPEFDAMLEAAKSRHAKDEEAMRALNRVEAKWLFIRESLVSFYENAVPFLVHRYSQQIVGSLTEFVG